MTAAHSTAERGAESAFGCHFHRRRVYLWLLSVTVMSGLDDTETLVAPSGETLRKDAPDQSRVAHRPHCGRVNFSVHFAASQPLEQEARHRSGR